MTTINATNSVYTYNSNKSDRAEKAKKFIRVAVPVIAATVVTKKALNHSGVKLADIFKNGNASKLWNSVINVLSAPVNAIKNKFSKIAGSLGCAKLAASQPVTGGSGLKATLTTIIVGAFVNLVSKITDSIVDFISGKVNDKLAPKSQENSAPKETLIDETV